MLEGVLLQGPLQEPRVQTFGPLTKRETMALTDLEMKEGFISFQPSS